MAVWSIINKSLCISSKRIDAERFKPNFTTNESFLKSLPHKRLKFYIKEVTGGATPLGANYPKVGISFVRVQNIRANYIDLSDVVYIDSKIHNGQLYRSQINNNDVLLTITGVSYGNSAVAFQEMLPANMNQHSVRIKLSDSLNPRFLSAFLNCKFGRLQSDSKVTGDTRPALTYNEISNYLIPNIEINKQIEIADILYKSTKLRLQSQSYNKQATDLLEKQLGIDKISFEKPKSYITSFSEVVNNFRSDADFYQTKYRQLDALLNAKSTVALSSVCNFLKGFEVGTSLYTLLGPVFIRVSNLTKEGFKFGNADKYISQTTYSYLQKYQPIIGDILLTKDGTIGTCYVVDENVSGIISSGIIKLGLKDNSIPKEYLALVINSKICQMQAERECSGALITHWKPDQIRKLRIPILDNDIMQEISHLVVKSKEARKQSQQLLIDVKAKVEKLIEDVAN